ncbi:MAG: ABC transporter ATP-binding protein [Pyrinomonadaceae bacterium MAG19_C2-C3]|nr:ABC transporter ATP-binding protein [Pyrinomonadaceae bacterium MAG19_C2-C3]
MNDLEFNRVSKRYLVPEEEAQVAAGSNRLLSKLKSLRKSHKEFWAVRDVSFQVARGEALGIIGHNGAGKSTVLKLIAGITSPTAGEIKINGRLAALIEVGSGFHPELTGRENIYLSGTILGMSRREITSKLDLIIDFAGVREFIETPVKRYSSGMYVRLGFAIAAHLDPDVLLLDEVLAVGDAAFQTKCFEHISRMREEGKTIVFISHDLHAVESLCSRTILIHRGELVANGAPREVIAEYAEVSSRFTQSTAEVVEGTIMSKEAAITSLSFESAEGANHYRTGAPLVARITYTASEPIADVKFGVYFYAENGELHSQFTTEWDGERIDLEPGIGTLTFLCPALSLQRGIYYADAAIIKRDAADGVVIDWQPQRVILCVDFGKTVRGMFYMPHEWHLARHGETKDESSAENILVETS